MKEMIEFWFVNKIHKPNKITTMAIKQLFIQDDILIEGENKEFLKSTCQKIKKDEFNWDDAEDSVNGYKNLLNFTGLGKFLSFALTQTSINKLLGQEEGLDAVKIYLTYSPVDKTIRAFAVASKLNTSNGEFDDYKLPKNKNDIPIKDLPFLENVRPCPHQCGKENFLNKEL